MALTRGYPFTGRAETRVYAWISTDFADSILGFILRDPSNLL
jgi:hypothetical protein